MMAVTSKMLTSTAMSLLFLAILVVDGTPTCSSCKDFVFKFEKQMDKTQGKSSGAGNTAWEESRGIKYDSSDTRLMEIMENICGKNDHKCNEVAELSEEHLESWWSERQANTGFDGISFQQAICVKGSKSCCESGHFGPKCTPCPGGAKYPCSGWGTCEGNEDRSYKGKPKCSCYDEYIGKRCAKCAANTYKDIAKDPQDNNGLGFFCEKCNESCAKGCRGSGPADCKNCATGFVNNTESGACEDIDECLEANKCPMKAVGKEKHSVAQFCTNTPGSFKCQACDVSCDRSKGCVGSGPENCSEASCNEGYEHQESKGCADVNECLAENICGKNQFCKNTPGSHTCEDCDVSCGDEGCSSTAATGCVNCKEGFRMPIGKIRGCEDIDECENPVCKDNMECVNTEGSFQCSPKQTPTDTPKEEL